MDLSDQILQLEKEALAGWAGGKAMEYLLHAADDITYFDDIGANTGLVGLDAVTEHFGNIAPMLDAHKYEMVGEQVQVFGNTAVLSYNYHPFTFEGEPQTKWRATIVYNQRGDTWKVVHMHWTMHRPI